MKKPAFLAISILLLAASGAVQAGVVYTGLGTAAPLNPQPLGSYMALPFNQVPQAAIPAFSNVATIPGSPIPGDLTTNLAVNKRNIGGGWATWSHGYTGVVYYSNGATSMTLVPPLGTGAFYFYLEPNPFAVINYVVTTENGTSSGSVGINGSSGAQGFGFHTTAGERILSICISGPNDFAIGEFGAAAAPGGPAAPPATAVLTAPATICQGKTLSASVTAIPGATYYWSVTNFSGFASVVGNPQGTDASFVGVSPGTVAVEVTIFLAQNCAPIRLFKSVTVLGSPTTPAIDAPTAVTVGESGLTASVASNAGSTYAWTVDNGTITAGAGTASVTFTAGDVGTMTLTVTETNANGCAATATTSITVAGLAGPCVADGTTLCLNEGRFQVQVAWATSSDSGSGNAVPFAPAPPDSGYFWFFEAENMELLIKVLDGRGVNGKFWVMYGALSDVAYTISILDTVTGETKAYTNPQGQLASVADIEAFSDAVIRPAVTGLALGGLEASVGPVSLSARIAATLPKGSARARGADVERAVVLEGNASVAPASISSFSAGCTPSGTVLCLNGGRFQVSVDWEVSYPIGTFGPGRTVPVTDDTGCFWFFGDRNIELAAKVLDGTGVNGKYWVFFGALSDVAYTVTVKDTVTGAEKVYGNPQGTLASVADIEAFEP